MRECAKCGRQNQPTRKYCTRCGASLLRVEDEQPQASEKQVVTKAPAAPAKPQPEVISAAEEPLVRPSKVATDRVRPPERHVEKTELEKAREAFARAEDVGIEEATGEGIVETRMLRASEVRELMDSAAGWAETAPPQPTATPDGPETPAAPSMPTPKDIERGILGSKSEYVEKPDPIPEPTPPQPSVGPVSSPPGAPSAPTTIPKPQTTIPPQPSIKPAPKTPSPPAAPKTSPAAVATQDVTAEMWEYEAKVPDKVYLEDVTIKGTLSDLKHLLIEMKQVQTDLSSCKARQDEAVLQYRNTAEVKRINFESLQEQSKHAKQEWNDAEKEYQRAEDRRKKEISSIEKRLSKIEKQINKAESTMTKRVKDLDKEKEKRAQEQAKST
ncbi:MAG: hypothetical protein ACFFFO_01990 [Candidatus Thorarchaeota archaeon]